MGKAKAAAAQAVVATPAAPVTAAAAAKEAAAEPPKDVSTANSSVPQDKTGPLIGRKVPYLKPLMEKAAIQVHPSAFPDLIGKGGVIIRTIKESLGAEISIPKV